MLIVSESIISKLGITNILGYIIGLIGIFLSIYFYIKSKKKKAPAYRTRSTTLIESAVSGIDSLEVYYENRKLTALTITKLAFWNSGRDTISSDEISCKDPLRLVIRDDFEILSCDILIQSKDANNFSALISDDKKSVLLSFDYIDFEEGAVLRIRHTGSSSNDVSIKGSIKTVSSILKKDSFDFYMKKLFRVVDRRVFIKGTVLFTIVYSVLIAFLCCCKVFFSDTALTQFLFPPEAANNIFNKIMLAMLIVIMMFLCVFYGFHFLKRPVPKSLASVFLNDTF